MSGNYTPPSRTVWPWPSESERVGDWLIENWNATYEGVRVHEWITRNALRCGGVRAAAQELMRLSTT